MSGARGGGSLHLHQFAREGVALLGRVQVACEHRIALAPNLKELPNKNDEIETNLLKRIDDFIEITGIDVPRKAVPKLHDGYNTEVIAELDLKAAGIGTIIWAMGYTWDFTFVGLPVFHDDGCPGQRRGVTQYTGLFFLGLHWLYTRKSALLLGVGEDAAYVADHIAGRGR